MFNPPGDNPKMYWKEGHFSDEEFLDIYNPIFLKRGILPLRGEIKRGWASFKLQRIKIYISDQEEPNFLPITYWIPDDRGQRQAG